MNETNSKEEAKRLFEQTIDHMDLEDLCVLSGVLLSAQINHMMAISPNDEVKEMLLEKRNDIRRSVKYILFEGEKE